MKMKNFEHIYVGALLSKLDYLDFEQVLFFLTG